MKHGKTGTRIYRIWCSMKQRCFYHKHNRYKNYGGRGITMSIEWMDFNNFYNDMFSEYASHSNKYGESNTTIERIDVNGNYCKENCKWETLENQNLNRLTNNLITYNNQTKPVVEWEREYGFNRGRIQHRLKRGWTIEQVFNSPRYTVINKRTLTDTHKNRIKESMLKHFST